MAAYLGHPETIAKEGAYLDGLKQGRCKNAAWREKYGLQLRRCAEYHFVYVDAEGKDRGAYKWVEAFLLRRIHNDGASIEDLKYWAERVLADMPKQAQ